MILPSSFTRGPRAMVQDSMAIFMKTGTVHLFITITGNPTWIEIQENVYKGQT